MMTLDDLLAHEAIRHTMTKYNMAGDRLQVDAFAECFAEDGIIESERAPGDYIFRYEGRAAIRAWQSRWRNREPAQDTVHKARFVRHHLSTCHIELTGPETATARTYWVAWTDIGADHAGYYLDDFQNVGGLWLIARRRVRLDWQSPDSLFVTAIRNTSA
jgi:SnoaL-like domain